ncbi:ClbS/DfsB family four-helix bundle protein [Croceitalea sp. MTPC9]|uniref:ClbS/DfsB family four-helix bundle protein n=1 Tax=unclassified Croceitalea TaxID=2632280 RepID=UPI002B37F3CB|nr:ClbS/DfsB family four-helix bundle protein [Croceitalea sp. MTPC6]GMN17998.1 ClbS/DfsB family four-helix bundle protein [Croceitalea sp. MTPC9]
MPRPKTKNELLALNQANYAKLTGLVESFATTKLKKEFPEGYLNRNSTDVLAHLHHWHLMVLDWYTLGMKGIRPDMPAKGYTWKTVPELNISIQKKYKDAHYSEVRKMLDASYHSIQKLIKKHSDQELFEKKKYKWTGSTSLGAYLISATSSHYDWAYKLISKVSKEK